MTKNETQILMKMNSFRNRYSNNEDFIADMNNWPKTVRRLIFSNEKLMVYFGLVELVPEDKMFIGME